MADTPQDNNNDNQDSGTIGVTGRWVLVATISASSMAFIMGTALNVALPAIQRDLGATGGDLLWIVNSYALLLAALLLVGGSLGDIYGRNRIYGIGIVTFILSSVFCGFAPNADILIIARGLQGIGGALMVPGSLAIISAYFDDDTRGTAIGTWSLFTTVTSVLGPLLGGFLAENGLWRVIFFINIPLALLSLFALLRYVPESYGEDTAPRLDYVGAALVAVALCGITFGSIGIGEVGVEGFTRLDLMGSLIGGFIFLGIFIWWEDKTDMPMLPLDLFKSSTFTGANLLTLFLYGALGAGLFFLPLNLVQVQGYGETVAGLALLPFSALLALLSPFMGNFVDRFGPRIPLVAGPAIVAISFVALSVPGITGGPADYWTTFLPGGLLLGLGMGITVAPLTTSVMGSVPRYRSGIASGINNAMSRSSQVLTTSIMGGIALLFFSGILASALGSAGIAPDTRDQILMNADDLANTPIPDAVDEATAGQIEQIIDESFISTFRLMMWIAAGLSALSAVLAAMTISSELQPPDELKRKSSGKQQVSEQPDTPAGSE